MRTACVVVLVALCACGALALKKGGINSKLAMHPSIIEAVNSDPDATWEAGVNSKFAGMTLGEVKHFLGAKKRAERKLQEAADFEEIKALPTDFDARTQWGKTCPSLYEIRDQSDCGSCWAFGAAEAMTDRTCIASNGDDQPHISAADLLSCCDECGDGCDGGYPETAWEYWVDTGLVTGGNWSATIKDNGCFPYPFPPCEHHVNGTHYPKCPTDEYATPVCPKKCNNSESWTQDKWHGKSAGYFTGVAKIQQELYTNGPLEVAFDVYEDFLTYKAGVYTHLTGSYLGGHAVKLIGWGVENGQKYWTIINSWNEDWGDNGQFKIAQGTDECGIEDDVCAGLPA